MNKILIGLFVALGLGVLKLISNANNPDRQVKKDKLRLSKSLRKLIRRKNYIENEIKNCKDEKKRSRLEYILSAVVLDIVHIRQRLEKLAYWNTG